jgi:hypothetical protein
MTKPAASFGIAIFVALLVVATAAPVKAQAIYRCEQGGRVTYSDAPCEKPLIQQVGSAPSTSAPRTQKVIGGGYTSPYGPWSGQTQFQIMNSNVAQSEGTHFIAFMDVMIGDDGKVAGASAENSCRMLGLASPGFTPAMLNLDVTLSNCPVQSFNRRYHGTLIMNAKNRTAQFNVRALQIGIGQAVIADIKATLAR